MIRLWPLTECLIDVYWCFWTGEFSIVSSYKMKDDLVSSDMSPGDESSSSGLDEDEEISLFERLSSDPRGLGVVLNWFFFS